MARQDGAVESDSQLRSLTGVLRPIEATHPVERALADHPDLVPVAIHDSRIHDGDTCITLLQIRGDRAALRDLLDGHPAVHEFLLAGEGDTFAYLQGEPTELLELLFAVRDDAELVVRMPWEHTGDGGIRGTLIGEPAAFQHLADSLPETIDLEVERIGDHHPDVGDVFSSLTDRQQDVLATAVRAGYYEDPRRATQRDLATTLDVAPATVSQHLRRIEAKVFSAFAGETAGADGA